MSNKPLHKSSSLVSNLDVHLTPAARDKEEMQRRRKEFVAAHTSKAEKDERDGTAKPGIVFGFQKQGVYTADPIVDKDEKRIRKLGKLPVKEYIVTPDGKWAMNIGEPGDAAYEAARAGEFCTTCENRQPDLAESWEIKMSRLELHAGKREPGMRFGSHCCYCGGQLGFAGDAKDQSLTNIDKITGEQKMLLEKMFGPMKAQ